MTKLTVIGLRGIPDVMGGIETHCAQLLPHILANVAPGELKITLLARQAYVDARKEVNGVEQIPIWAPRHPSAETIVHTLIALLYARFVLRTDLVHLHAIGPGLLAPMARLLGLRLLFTHHGADYRRQKWGPFSRFMLRRGESLAVRFSHRVITVSPSTAKRLQARFPKKADRIVHIPNGFSSEEPSEAIPDLLAKHALNAGSYVISVGRLVPEKAHDLLIKAFQASRLPLKEPPWKLVIVGDSDHASDYARSLSDRAERDENIILVGKVPRKTVLALNAESGLFVLPSYHEGLSIAALEALHSGVPVLLSDIDANLNIGLPQRNYFPVGSTEKLTEKLDADLSDYTQSLNVDLSHFDWQEIARTTLAEIELLAGGAPLRRIVAPHAEQQSKA
ncbi:glycosyltransferase family 4 protein [Roseovarius sp. E0-M6]|uniref:glycosyltransferase family 4 protein n=1 Tax=Roseovarius sp. E0-M6 TaxID=3127118 RepID=UPI00300FDEB8